MKKKHDALAYMRHILRFGQFCLIGGIIGGLVVIYYYTVLGILISSLALGALVYSFIIEARSKRRLEGEIKEQVDELVQIRQDILVHSHMPVAVINRHGNIWWYNASFAKMLQEEELIGTHIRTWFSDLQMEALAKSKGIYERSVKYNKSYYHLTCERMVKVSSEKDFNYIMYFVEETDKITLQETVDAQRGLVGHLYIDNFDEIMQSIEEVKRPMLMAVIDRKINLWFRKFNVAICKIEKEKYMLFFTMGDLEKMQERKFDILDDLRNIQVGNELPVTASIGIGQNSQSIVQSKDDGRAALDLALGRGGDQAILKKGDKYTFYGGKTKEVEKSARVKVRIKAYAFKELLHESDRVFIMGHKNMDMDCLGAAMGVYRAATIMGKKAHILLERPTFAIEALYNRIIEAPEYQDLFMTSQQIKEEMKKDSLLVIVDGHSLSYVECPQLLEMTERVVVFDHHRLSTDFVDNAVLTYIEPFISSTCEIIAEILNYITDKVKLTHIEADALLAGITIDTKNFMFKAGVRTFEAAAFLRRNGADSTRVRLLFQNDMETYRIKAGAIKNAEIWRDDIAIAVVEEEVPHANIIAAQVADELLSIKGIASTFVFTMKDGDLLISARALGKMNMQRIMEILGGGGHQGMAGAQLKEVTVEEAKVKLKEAIEKYFEEGE
jgi:c-di-AMP phosphodiesterase-like protein